MCADVVDWFLIHSMLPFVGKSPENNGNVQSDMEQVHMEMDTSGKKQTGAPLEKLNFLSRNSLCLCNNLSIDQI